MSDADSVVAALNDVARQIGELEQSVTEAERVRHKLLDKLFNLTSGLKIGDDVIYTGGRGTQKDKRARIMRQDNRWWSGDGKAPKSWSCQIQFYKKDGTLGMNKTHVFTMSYLTKVEDSDDGSA